MSKLLSKIFFLGLFLLLVGGLGAGYFLFKGSSNGETKEVIIPRGASLGVVAQTLADQGIISHAKVLKYLLNVTQGTQRVRAGEFRFHLGMSFIGALNALYRDEPIIHSVTLPEGWTVKQYAEILQKAGLIESEKFLKIALSQEGAKKFNLKSPSLEGFLFPDTYTFSKVDGEERIVETLVKRFRQKFGNDYQAEIQSKGWTLERLVTLASIVEKETGVGGERAKVASVFHNRMKKRMRLQSDPTTIYGIANFNGNLTRADLQRYTPYNTYTIPELPPGPISNPGLEALVGALRPMDTKYLYFVGNNKGEHIFSETLSQHNHAVDTYQKKAFAGRQIGRVERRRRR